MEYAAVFILFSALVASAIKLAATGKGLFYASFLSLLTALLCLEPTKGAVRYAPSTLFLACAGAAYIGRERSLKLTICALAVAAVRAVSTDGTGDPFAAARIADICQIALSACVSGPYGAGAVFALGRVLGDTYSVYSDFSVIFRETLFSVDTVFYAVICTVISFFIDSVFSFADGKGGCQARTMPLYAKA